MPNLQLLQNIVGGSRQADRRLLNSSYSQNMYPEPQGEGALSSSVLRSIQGMETRLELPGTPRGSFVASRGLRGEERLFVCYDTAVYAIDPDGKGGYVATKCFNVALSSSPVSFCETGGGAESTYIVCVDGTNCFAVKADTDPNDFSTEYHVITLPVNAKGETIRPTHCAYLYNYLVVNDVNSDAFYRSEAYPFENEENGSTNYDVFTHDVVLEETLTTGFYTFAEWMPDNITALISTGSNLWVMGDRSFQVFQYQNSVNNPFTSPNTAAQAIGILAPHSLARIGEQVFWLGASDIGHLGVYQASGTSPQRISNPDLEREMASLDSPNAAVGQAWVENAHLFYAITLGGKTFVYDASTGLWHNRVSTTYGTNKDNEWRYKFAIRYGSKGWFFTRGACVTQTESKFTEHDGTPIIRIRRGGAIINNFQPFFIDAVRLVCTNGYASQTEYNPCIMMRYSTDLVSDWNERIGSLGRRGQYNFVTEFLDLGLASSFVLEFSCSDNCPFDIIACPIIWTPCGM